MGSGGERAGSWYALTVVVIVFTCTSEDAGGNVFCCNLTGWYTRGMGSPADSIHAATDAFTAADFGGIVWDTSSRRRLSAYALALPPSVRPTSEALGLLVGCAAVTIRADWRHPAVRDLARASCAAGLSALLVASARGYLVRTCGRAMAGDDAAGAALLPWLDALGATLAVIAPSAGDVVLSDPDALDVPGVDVFATDTAREALETAMRML